MVNSPESTPVQSPDPSSEKKVQKAKPRRFKILAAKAAQQKGAPDIAKSAGSKSHDGARVQKAKPKRFKDLSEQDEPERVSAKTMAARKDSPRKIPSTSRAKVQKAKPKRFKTVSRDCEGTSALVVKEPEIPREEGALRPEKAMASAQLVQGYAT